MKTKLCGHCKQEKIIDNFYISKNTTSGFSSWCKQCSREKNRRYNIEYYRNLGGKNKEKWRKIKQSYNVNKNEYNEMLKKQNNKCKICGRIFTYNNKTETPHIDHCHSSGIIRGLLCDRCNKGLGHFGYNIETLKKAIVYLDFAHLLLLAEELK